MQPIDKLRRQLLATLGIGAGASALAATAGATTTAIGKNHLELTIDVAVLGHTSYDDESGALNRHPDYVSRDPQKSRDGFKKSDLRGTSFFHEGLVYPGGTIAEPKTPRDVQWNFEKPPQGTFFDRGWVLINNLAEPPYVPRTEPHLLSHTDYYLGGVVGSDNLTPSDMIATVGMQHDNSGAGTFLRAVVGGTGKYATVRGQLWQTHWGNNSSALQGAYLPPGVKIPSPNFRIRFELYL